ncbi:hypothetical protein AWN90_27830 [Nocardia terpenica]|uniref:SGNH hydrolase-type esterase domain-containing protein n=1 Tax=Nocardia terpenica TaxID=455432 RepID=A0A164LNM4_9NOCA|nr:hypothetical protein AWN90_27830 [Nocardia terpenica]NQE92505.1 hypothetical protein [Nocardia terpenica]
MLTNPCAATVLCYGDSNTFGVLPDQSGRWPVDVRWTGLMQRRLGDGYDVLEEGLGSRTTDLDYSDRPGRNGRRYLLPCLASRRPLDIVVLMLGTNDTKIQFGRTPAQIAAAVDGLIDLIRSPEFGRDDSAPAVVLLAPVPIDHRAPLFDRLNGDAYDARSAETSRRLAPSFAELAARRGLPFADTATVAEIGEDGVHLGAEAHARIAELVGGLIRNL